MAPDGMEIRPLAPAMGAEVLGVDLAGPLSDDQVAAIRRALLDHLVIFFRDQELTPRAQAAFARRLGPLDRYAFVRGVAAEPDIIEVVKEPDDVYNFGGVWHSDGTYNDEPVMATVLHARELPPAGGDTLFSNMYLAYDALSPGMKVMLAGLKALNSTAKRYEGVGRIAGLRGRTSVDVQEPSKSVIEAVHPVVRTHPETGRRALYVNAGHTIAIEGMDGDESDALLDYLFEHAIRPEFTVRFRWHPGSLALWDNRCTQHFAVNDYPGHRRVMHRATVAGDRPA